MQYNSADAVRMHHWFLGRSATHILAFEGDSRVQWFEGNFEADQEDERRRITLTRRNPTGSGTGLWHGELSADTGEGSAAGVVVLERRKLAGIT